MNLILKKNLKTTINIIIILIGVLLITYPLIGKLIYYFNKTEAIEKFKEIVVEMEDEKIQEIKDDLAKEENNNKGNIIGFIEINKINLKLPIFEGTEEKSLLKGVCHFENTRIPSKTRKYHSIFLGHTGINSKKIFDDLIYLELGEKFLITILNDTFEYKIKNIQKVLPNEAEKFKDKIKYNKKQVTLITCTPKYINSHRLLITGEELR